MRDILSGGVLTPAQAPTFQTLASKPRPRRRGSRTNLRGIRSGKCASSIQPGQLAAPSAKFGFPSLALH
jgi:hypothetical protein